MWATASLIRQAGCDNVHLRCASTDVDYVLGKYHDGGVELSVAHDCIEKKCPEQAAAARAAQGSSGGTAHGSRKRRLHGKEL